MKLIYIFVAILCLDSGLASAKVSKKGWSEAYGGHSTVVEFKSLAIQVFSKLSTNFLKSEYELEKAQVIKLIHSSEVICGSGLYLDDQPKTAINYPELKKIILDCEKWESVKLVNSKMHLVIHEYLHLLNIDDSSYEYSLDLMLQYLENQKYNQVADENLYSSLYTCNLEKFKIAIEAGANIYRGIPSTTSPFTIAIKHGCFNILQQLVLLGVTPAYEDKDEINNSLAILYLDPNAFFERYNYDNRKDQLSSSFIALYDFLISHNIQLANLKITNSSTSFSLKSSYAGSTLLHLVALNGDLNLYLQLLNRGFDSELLNTQFLSSKDLIKKFYNIND